MWCCQGECIEKGADFHPAVEREKTDTDLTLEKRVNELLCENQALKTALETNCELYDDLKNDYTKLQHRFNELEEAHKKSQSIISMIYKTGIVQSQQNEC